MSHEHHHGHHHHTPEKIGLVFFLNASFALLELVGGLMTNSIAIISDAVHDAGDSLVLGLSWLVNRKARQRGSDHFTFGFARFRMASALLTGTVLLTGSLLVISRAIPRLFSPEYVNSKGMLLLAIIGVGVNTLALFQLGRGKSVRLDVKMISLHLLEDVFGWVAVLLTAVVLMFTDWYILDPLLSIGIAVYIIHHALHNLFRTFKILLQATPAGIDLGTLEKQIVRRIAPHSVHHLHLWSLDGEAHVLTLHLRLCTPLTAEQSYALKQSIRGQLEALHIHHSTIEIEQVGEACAVNHPQLQCRPQSSTG